MAIAFFSVAAPHQTHTQFYKRDLRSRNPWYQKQCSAIVTCPPPSRLIFTLCSPSSTALVEDDPSSLDALAVQSEPTAEDTREIPRSCKACGREEIEKGCNGEGRIQGGIATIPGFGWWPIKAYRPCPGFVASGGRYRRQGQSMDEVAFGSGGETVKKQKGKSEEI
ncbi:hypothetical protein L6164_028342 [Bauhinia variegata]|uniref:Uncharacterized protein n=1 Tax=Bauhinia variegata TaxID=167791 RepID=A0ACB9LX93_BAUVA|nr:hypothetical protein L6164_028342 [Bauhinia variegata]